MSYNDNQTVKPQIIEAVTAFAEAKGIPVQGRDDQGERSTCAKEISDRRTTGRSPLQFQHRRGNRRLISPIRIAGPVQADR